MRRATEPSVRAQGSSCRAQINPTTEQRSGSISSHSTDISHLTELPERVRRVLLGMSHIMGCVVFHTFGPFGPLYHLFCRWTAFMLISPDIPSPSHLSSFSSTCLNRLGQAELMGGGAICRPFFLEGKTRVKEGDGERSRGVRQRA